ncbi:MAG TPA: ABC transporter permease subunit [Burkholderiaceae bacterium]
MSAIAATAHAHAAGATTSAPPRRPSTGQRFWWTGFAAAATWLALGAVTRVWPNRAAGFSDWAYTDELGLAAYGAAGLLLALAVLGIAGTRIARVTHAVRPAGAWLIVLPLLLGAWEVLTAKTGRLPTPFFAPPQNLVEVYGDDWQRLGNSAWHSLRLLAHGFAIGTVCGFLTGVAIGWSRGIGYWVHPVIRFVGPIPASALLPLAFFTFPSSYAAAVFVIAFATFFPMTILTWSGVASVNRQYYDVARTLGASEWFLVLRVAIPAALPQVFVGLFMALGASFSVLVIAEMMGVKAGLGWYLTWAQGWASYGNMYAALIIMAVICSSTVTLLFVLRDRVLSWQKGTLKW